MTQRWMVVAIVLLVAVPSTLSARWIKDVVYLQTQDVGKVAFSHFNHLEAVGNNCPSCHNRIYNIVVDKNPAFTMQEMEKGKACGACHNGTKAFSVKGDCLTCHVNEVFFVTDVGRIAFSHEVHTGAFGCSDCHPDTFKAEKGANKATMAQMEKGTSCGACHDGSTAFGVKEGNNCVTCHANGTIVYETDAGKATFSHEVHTAAFGCDSCHPDIFKPRKGANKASMADMEEGSSCGACHDGNTAFSVKDEDTCATCHEM